MNRIIRVGLLGLLSTPLHAAQTAADILKESGVPGGLVVVVGCDDPGLLADLGGQARYRVQALDTRRDRIEKARAALRAAGKYGCVSVAAFDGVSLPYVDNLVNLLVMQGETYKIRDPEIMRILAPRGVAMTGAGKTIKPVPPGIDEWTHHLHDATGIGAGGDTVVSRPRSIQWKAGPEYSRSHENMSSVSAVVSADGRVFSIMDEGPTASIYLPPRWFLSARDAFSGVLLWKIPIDTWHAALFPLKSGPQQLPRRLVATGRRVYVTLGIDAPVSELDAATGDILRTFADTAHAEELICANGRLLTVAHEGPGVKPYRGRTPDSRRGFTRDEQTLDLAGARSVVCVDTAAGKTAWRTPPGPVVPLTIAAGGEGVFLMRADQLVCLDVTTGKERWVRQAAARAVKFGTTQSPTLLVHQGVVYVAQQGKLTARDTATGESLWSAPCATTGYNTPANLFIVNDLIWDVNTGGEPYRPGSNPDTINRTYTGHDLRTGKVLREIPTTGKHGYAIMHHRCHVPRATGRFIVTSFPGIEFFDVETGRSTHDSWIRGACLYGFMPANGLIYTPPHPCACYTQGKLTGFWAVAGARTLPEPSDQPDRLEKGPAYESIRDPESGIPNASDWPTYRADAARSGTTPGAIPLQVRALWQEDVGPDPSPCTIACGKLFVATAEDHTVHALDAATGKPLWHHTADGRVDSVPTFHRGTILFGSRDGYVYCLTADRGELIWRFRAAPIDRRCVVYDQVESVWPVHGSVLVQDDVLWFCAGRSSFLDGGLRVYRLEPRTGRVLSTTRVDSLGKQGVQPPITSTMFARLDMEGAKNDVLSGDGTHVFMRHWAFDPEDRSVKQDVDHLFSPTGFLDDSWYRRTYWIYGRIYVSGAQGWARTGNIRPTGRILSIDEERVYGFGRDLYPPSPGNSHQMYLAGEKERFFAALKNDAGRVAPPDPSAPKSKRAGKDTSKRGKAPKSVLWSTPGDLQARGMVLAGEGADKRLFVAGARGDWVISQNALDGKDGSVLRILSIDDGRTLAEHALPGLPVFDGMSAADGRLYITLGGGRVLCLGADDPPSRKPETP